MTRSFGATVANCASHDLEFRAALVEETLQAILDGDKDIAHALEAHQNHKSGSPNPDK